MRIFTPLAIVAGCFLAASTMAYHDVQAQHAHMCHMIGIGAWPEAVEPSCTENRND